MRKACVLLLFILGLLYPRVGLAKPVCAFAGKTDASQRTFDVIIDCKKQGSITGHGSSPALHQFNLHLTVDDLLTPFFEISTEFDLFIELIEGKGGKLMITRGKMGTHNSLIDHKPAQELTGNFEVREGRLQINHFSIQGFSGNGTLKLSKPYPLDLTLRFSNIAMTDFLFFWFKDDPNIHADGTVSGELQLTGSFEKPLLKGKFTSFNGVVNGWEYDSITLNAEGVYPVIKLSNSTITQADGFSFNIEGSFDLSDKKLLQEQIQKLQRSPLISEDSNSLEWTIKRKEHEGTSGKTEFKYMRRKDDKSDPAQKNTDMIGVERSIDF